LRDEDIYIYKIRQFYLYLPIRIRSPRSNWFNNLREGKTNNLWMRLIIKTSKKIEGVIIIIKK
jgi:hypothetical protein